jgi:transketolase
VETVECWQAALAARRSPSILVLTRQNLPAVRRSHVQENLSALGAYEISPAKGKAAVSIFASGSEVSIALAAQALLAERSVAARVVSVPCMERFAEQGESYRRQILGDAPVRVGVEAAVRQGWDALIGDGPFVGMTGFGASGPYKQLYQHFGVTPARVAEAALARLRG